MKPQTLIPVTLTVGYPSTYPVLDEHDFSISVNLESNQLIESYLAPLKNNQPVIKLVFETLHKEMASGNPRRETQGFFKELKKIKEYPGEIYIEVTTHWLSVIDSSEGINDFFDLIQEEVALNDLTSRLEDFKINNPAYNSEEDLRKLLIKYLQHN